MKIDLYELKNFLIKANKSGYAFVKGGSAEVLEKDSSRTITYKEGNWAYQDNYFGGDPYGGREVVHFDNKSVFITVYYGNITDKNFDKEFIYGFLRKALRAFPNDMPVRGPKEIEEIIDNKKIRYENNWFGDVDYFYGQEKILIDGKEVYGGYYSGGLVDQR